MNIIVRDPLPGEEDSIVFSLRNIPPHVAQIISSLKNPRQITVFQDKNVMTLSVADILYVESVDLKTFIYTERDMYQAKQKLYEVEKELSEYEFLRINRQVIVNIKKIKSISPAGAGRFQALLTNNEKVIISRRNVSVLKKLFGL